MTQRFLTSRQAAEFCGFSPRTFDAFRVRGGGPAWMKRGRRVLYDLRDLEAWMLAGRVTPAGRLAA